MGNIAVILFFLSFIVFPAVASADSRPAGILFSEGFPDSHGAVDATMLLFSIQAGNPSKTKCRQYVVKRQKFDILLKIINEAPAPSANRAVIFADIFTPKRGMSVMPISKAQMDQITAIVTKNIQNPCVDKNQPFKKKRSVIIDGAQWTLG
jgi:hypothetical protein